MLSRDNFEFSGLLGYFEAISDIPRASYKESKIADYLCDFAKSRGLEYYRDGTNNVLINAPATKGCESAPALLLQGHTDMVCEKNAGVEHNFDTDPLELYEENGWIRARGTTLGADDGVAVAIMLYILDGGVERHGPLQCLFTASEEVGLDGVKAFDYSRIYARRMINIDSPDEAEVIAGCAGGQRSSMTFEVSAKTVRADVAQITVSGLYGGHSGEDINRGRANANKLMGRVLYRLLDGDVQLVSIHGGTKDNAIPRECVATVAVADRKDVEKKIEKLRDELACGMSEDDKNFSLTLEFLGERETEIIDDTCAKKVVFVMHTVANGVFEMNHNVSGLVEWSRNLGIVSCDKNGAELVFSSRSSYEARIELSEAELDDYASALGASVRHYNRYPGWSFAPTSEIRDCYVNAFERILGVTPEITVIHAGLECGFISRAVPNMDIISCGPQVKDLHSPDEALNKDSFQRFFKVIKHIIEVGL